MPATRAHPHFIHNFWEQCNSTLYGLYGAMVVVTFDGNGAMPSQQSKGALYRKEYGTLACLEEGIGYEF